MDVRGEHPHVLIRIEIKNKMKSLKRSYKCDPAGIGLKRSYKCDPAGIGLKRSYKCDPAGIGMNCIEH